MTIDLEDQMLTDYLVDLTKDTSYCIKFSKEGFVGMTTENKKKADASSENKCFFTSSQTAPSDVDWNID